VKIIPQRGDQDKIQKHGSNYVGLENGAEYNLFLGNDRNTEAMAEVHVEGENIGTFFIPANQNIIIERPADSSRKFVFVSERDYRASQAGVISGEFTNGLVRVIFYPKKQKVYSPRVMRSSSPRLAMQSSRSSMSYGGGATILGDKSYQTFGTKSRFEDSEIDWNNKTEITIRLVVKQEYIISKPYVSISNRNNYQTSIPPRI